MELQLDWHIDRVRSGWAAGPDTLYVMRRLADLPAEVTAAGAPRRVLEVAAAEAVHSCKLSLLGVESFVVEPSPVMLEQARARMIEHGATLTLVRGVAEALPFRDRTFDRVLLDSAIDHLGEPGAGIREMARVLEPDGRMVIGFVNYESVSARLSRRLYRIARRLGVAGARRTLFWDSPVPVEHTFECTLPVLQQLCAPYLELDRVFGVSIGWMVPGWGRFLRRLPTARALALVRRLDAMAYRAPRQADFVVSVWHPRPGTRVGADRWPTVGSPRAVERTDLLYRSKVGPEAEFWAGREFGRGVFGVGIPGGGDVAERMTNQAYTGDPERMWIDDLIARGPFRRAAVLGCDEAGYERLWLERGGSALLDVYELSPDVIRKVRAGLGLGWSARCGPKYGPGRRVRFRRADLNFAALPAERYDVIWSSGCLHHIVNLEHLFDEVARALRPGGLFALCDYVGERRMQFAPARLARINAALEEVPERYRRVAPVVPVRVETLSPFCAVRPQDILPLAKARFDTLHEAFAGALFPLTVAVDLAAMEREAPDTLARVVAAEAAALAEPGARPCGVYAVFRRRA